jgi:hypothetical protein
MAPAISTPVAPPPTIAKVRRRWRSTASVASSARSKAMRMCRRMRVASSMRFEAGRHLGPFVVAEIGMGRACGEHEVVVGDAHRIDLHEPLGGINGADLGHQHCRVLLLAQNVADRPGHVGR